MLYILKSWWRRQRVDFDAVAEVASLDKDNGEKEIITKLFALPEKYRVVLYLFYFEDYSVREISKLLVRKESTIRSQLQRGREKLKNDLGGKNLG